MTDMETDPGGWAVNTACPTSARSGSGRREEGGGGWTPPAADVDNDILYSLTFVSDGRDDIIISPTPAAIWCGGLLAKNLSGVYEGK